MFREFGDWDRLDSNPNNTAYTFEGLRCGTNYQFYIQVSIRDAIPRFILLSV